MEVVKRLLHAGALGYVENAPFQRGKHRVLLALHKLVGPAIYDVRGLKMSLSPRHLIDNFIIRQGAFHPELVTFIEAAMARGGHFIDVGANIGFLSLVAARAAAADAHVYAFEPSRREYAVLLEHIALNGLMNVTAFPYAVGAREEHSTLWLTDLDNPGRNSRYRPTDVVSEVPIKIARIDSLLPAATFDGVACVKIDVEGDECAVLDGFERVMPRLRRAAFIVEIAADNLARAGHTVDDVYRFFERHGFRGCRPSRPDGDADEVFVAAEAPDPPSLWF
ncbi:MAG TPA: FkbM family methyltransferase [Polyangia bacterium]|nr:FkbM family methyltransferase [Polyangia bacterium]